ncbi:hypothetical protein EKH57_16275 [Halorubrum sp. BOL3-1]|uniref:hypothetical protein n=1 Tax=Halorubrum sp. BOL3-1 TaxID=2497325 RepID=UPI001004F50C|nr:hypothetical protein [Halorubrum sp. BOL3-1]QAU14121.1 hypothetical protein EKH57_16275 [Halorubrum sp. BOL3-1]
MNQNTHSSPEFITRRRAIAIGASAAVVSTAGCSTVLDAVGNQVFEEVNLLNQLNHEVTGSIEIVDPDGETVLDTSFDVPSTESDGDSNIVAYADVWTTTGEYQVDLELADTEISGTSQLNQRFSITSTEEELVAISIGSSDESEPIALRVGESFSDLGQTNETG